ncbi:TolC family protein [Limnovirga soli]|nr:TolC family protein [Limnovirga soli]
MKCRCICIIAVFLFFMVGTLKVKAQSVSLDSLLDKVLATDEILPKLIDSAIRYSPQLRLYQNKVEYSNATLKTSKNLIFNGLQLLSSYSYGTNISALNAGDLTTQQTSFYNVGVGLRLPVSDILNRKNIISATQSQLNMATAEKDNTIFLIRQDVIRLYQQFKLSHRLIAAASQNKQISEINYNIAEKQFLQGQITVEQLAKVSEVYTKSIVEFETSTNSFQTVYMQLEAYAGVNLSNLITKGK